jgi:hypothetical protein
MINNLAYESLNRLDTWQRMRSITLGEMSGVKLMNRVDTKYVLSYDEVLRLINAAADNDYYVQIIDGVRACRYVTLYYDTPEREMFVAHHNRKLTRQKLRTRTYVESGTTYFEIKDKSNRGRTKKRRTEIALKAFNAFASASEATALLERHSHYRPDEVSPALYTRFTRITLVNPTLSERITIDLELSYEDARSHTMGSIEQMAIVEIKQDGNTTSLTKHILRDMRIAPLKVSKYCLGTTLTVEGIKSNRFKAKLQSINKRLNRDKYDTI